MTSRQRLLAAIKREPVDMIPLSPRLGYVAHHHCGSESAQNILRLKDVYDFDPIITVEGQPLPFYNPYETYNYAPGVNVDMNITDEGTKRIVKKIIHTPDGDLTEVVQIANPGNSSYGLSPTLMHSEHMVKSPEDLPKIKHLIPKPDASYASEYHAWERLAGEEALIRAYIYAPLDYQASFMLSTADLMMNYLLNKQFVVDLAEMFREYVVAQTKALLEAGVKTFYASWYSHSLSVGWSPQMYREWFLPMVKEQVDLVHSYDGIVTYYEDGKMMQILEMLTEAGVDLAETCTPPPVGDVVLEDALKICKDKMTIMGHTDLIYVIQKGTPEDVRKAVQAACELGKDGGFILGTSDSIRENTPIENIDAYFKYGREYAKM